MSPLPMRCLEHDIQQSRRSLHLGLVDDDLRTPAWARNSGSAEISYVSCTPGGGIRVSWIELRAERPRAPRPAERGEPSAPHCFPRPAPGDRLGPESIPFDRYADPAHQLRTSPHLLDLVRDSSLRGASSSASSAAAELALDESLVATTAWSPRPSSRPRSDSREGS